MALREFKYVVLRYILTQTLQCPEERQTVDTKYVCILSNGAFGANLLLMTEGILKMTHC